MVPMQTVYEQLLFKGLLLNNRDGFFVFYVQVLPETETDDG
jgi:hypothetical protein